MEIDKKEIIKKVPTTRYQGSKRSILPWLYENFKTLNFKSVLDGFGGTGSVSYLLKLMGKKVTFNDALLSNYMTGVALVENQSVQLDRDDINFIFHTNGDNYPTFIEDSFRGIYYTSEENRWLDKISFNIRMLGQKYKGEVLKRKKALAYHILFQACLCKRPFNLFHRKNLYMRTARVDRSFGNKKTWNTSFRKLFLKFNNEISQKVFLTRFSHTTLCQDIMKIRRKKFDLVYLDPPYAKKKGGHPKDYYSLYHFFEGLIDYNNWATKINWNTKNRCLVRHKTGWDVGTIEDNFDSLFNKFRESIIVVSYGDPGYPSINRIKEILKRYKPRVQIKRKPYNYKLNHRNGGLYEVLITGE
ncbi:MAG TPA: DNA methyltransferase [bacterium]|nr:DNA methyltransferase [bacterium]